MYDNNTRFFKVPGTVVEILMTKLNIRIDIDPLLHLTLFSSFLIMKKTI